jgi:hypothetical protein
MVKKQILLDQRMSMSGIEDQLRIKIKEQRKL